MSASASSIKGIDLTTLKDNKHLFINSLPVDVAVTAEQLLKAMDNYIVNVADMKLKGITEPYKAESKALPLMRDYIRSLSP